MRLRLAAAAVMLRVRFAAEAVQFATAAVRGGCGSGWLLDAVRGGGGLWRLQFVAAVRGSGLQRTYIYR